MVKYMNNFQANYNKILEVLKSITEKEQFLKQKRKPKLKDIELIAMNLTAEYMSIDSECQLFREISIDLKSKIERSVYNRRKRKLFFAMEFIRKELSNKFNDCVILGDKGYLSADYQLDLFESKQIKLEVPMRKNQLNYKKQTYIFRKKRKRIETLFSQLCDQFMIRRNYAKSFNGFKTRILSKLTSLTIIQFINKFIFDRNINNLKISII